MTVGVQAKYWRPDQGRAGTEPIDQLLGGMENIGVGLVITTTEFEDEARAYAQTRSDETGKEMLLFDGLEFSQLIVDQGLRGLTS